MHGAFLQVGAGSATLSGARLGVSPPGERRSRDVADDLHPGSLDIRVGGSRCRPARQAAGPVRAPRSGSTQSRAGEPRVGRRAPAADVENRGRDGFGERPEVSQADALRVACPCAPRTPLSSVYLPRNDGRAHLRSARPRPHRSRDAADLPGVRRALLPSPAARPWASAKIRPCWARWRAPRGLGWSCSNGSFRSSSARRTGR